MIADIRVWSSTDSLDDVDPDLVPLVESDSIESEPHGSPPSRSSKAPLQLPEWFTSGTYTLQPGSRKYPLTLDEKHLAEKFVRGSGPGGQAINKLSTNVQLTHLPTGTKVTCQETALTRSQSRTSPKEDEFDARKVGES